MIENKNTTVNPQKTSRWLVGLAGWPVLSGHSPRCYDDRQYRAYALNNANKVTVICLDELF